MLPNDELVHEYSGNTQNVSVDSRLGIHIVQVLSKENTRVQMHASTRKGGQLLLSISETKRKNELKIEEKFGEPPHVQVVLP